MKIAITGHSKGIGKACADLFESEGHEIIGLSRSSGFDIQQVNMCAMKIIPCDMFINNAYLGTSQSQLFEIVCNHWRGEYKTIVNIGSRSQYDHNRSGSMYSADKVHLKRTAEYVAFKEGIENKKVRVINVNPGWVDTDMANLNLNPTSFKPPQDKMMSAEYIADMVKWCTDMPHDTEIFDLSLWKTTTD